MTSRTRTKRSNGKEVAIGAPRKPLGDIHHNGVEPAAPRKYQKTCMATGEDEEPITTKCSRKSRLPKAAVASKKVTNKRVVIEVPQLAEVPPIVFTSDSDEPSSEASPRVPAWFVFVPQKHRQVVKSILDNTGATITEKQKDLIIRDCCDNFKERYGYLEEFLQWIATHENVASLANRLCQTAVWSPIPSGTGSTAPSSPIGCLYTDEIYENLLSREKRFEVAADYMENVQRDITHNMRSILVDWLVEVGEEYKLSSQTLFLAVNYIDRLLGITCMLVAAKYEEIYPPTIQEFVYISDNTYTKKDVLTMESILLTSLQFNLSAPTSWEFARGFCNSASIGDRPKFLTNFFAELFMMFPCSLKYRPSITAASAIFLALYTLYLPPWPPGLMELAGNNKGLLFQCAEDMHSAHTKVLSEDHSLKAIREKFQESKWLKVSLIPSRPLNLYYEI